MKKCYGVDLTQRDYRKSVKKILVVLRIMHSLLMCDLVPKILVELQFQENVAQNSKIHALWFLRVPDIKPVLRI